MRYAVYIFLLVILPAFLVPGCGSGEKPAGRTGPVKIIYTGDVGGALDPCG